MKLAPSSAKQAMHHFANRKNSHKVEDVIRFIKELRVAYPLDRTYQVQMSPYQKQLKHYVESSGATHLFSEELRKWIVTGNLESSIKSVPLKKMSAHDIQAHPALQGGLLQPPENRAMEALHQEIQELRKKNEALEKRVKELEQCKKQ